MPDPRIDVDRLVSLRRVSTVAPSPDGTWLAVAASRLSEDGSKYVSDLWKVALDDPRAAPVQLTRGDHNDTNPRFRRDGSLGFVSNRPPPGGGDAQEHDDTRSQVWLLPARGGEPRPLTDEPLGAIDYRFAARADRLVVIAPVLLGVPHDQQRAKAKDRAKKGPSALHYTAQPTRLWDHWISIEAPHVIAYDEHGSDRSDLTPDADREHREVHFDVEWDLSQDGSRVVITDARIGADRLIDHGLRIIDVAMGTSSVIDPPPTTQLTAPALSPDGQRVACIRGTRFPKQCGKEELWVYDLASATGSALGVEWDRWPVPACWTADGSAVVCTADDRADEPVVCIDAETGAVTRITAASAGGSHGSIRLASDGRSLVGLRHCLLHPPEPFRVELAADAEPVLLAQLSGYTPEEGAALAQWERLETTVEDGTVVETLFIKPVGTNEPLPTLLWIHGGPIGQHADRWQWRWNPLVAVTDGYAVAQPNPRGSTGYGQAMIEGIWNNAWGAECYTDLMSVTDDLERRHDVDRERVAAMGGSFGGYMANWIGGQTDRYRSAASTRTPTPPRSTDTHRTATSRGGRHPRW
jgi:dipeptidyl aminopeptidase/acylaminoacyl peptidase